MIASWVCTRGISPAQVLDVLGLIQREPYDGLVLESALTGGETLKGWYFVAASWSLLPLEVIEFLDRGDMLARLSDRCELVACSKSETTMDSVAQRWINGERSWSVTHTLAKGQFHLEVLGEPPKQLERIRSATIGRQNVAGGEKADVDYILETPILIARRLTGFSPEVDHSPGLRRACHLLEFANPPAAQLGTRPWWRFW